MGESQGFFLRPCTQVLGWGRVHRDMTPRTSLRACSDMDKHIACYTVSETTTTTNTSRAQFNSIHNSSVRASFLGTLAVDAMSGVDGGGAAKRRRERRLRAQWRHEQQTVAMAVCAAGHHSSGLCKGQPNNVPRHQKMQAVRPGLRSELEPHGLVGRCVAGGNGDGPALSLPLFNNQVCDSVDASSLHFLVTQAFVDREDVS